jgi:syntaxin 6
MLEDLEEGVDRSESKLGTAMDRMKRFMRETEETKSGWLVIGLVIVLFVLLLLVVIL